jgi:prepilin-type N-terminal cleavage/methylation domain-containing protein
MASTSRAGVTLVELIVAMAVLATGLAVATGALLSAVPRNASEDAWEVRLRRGQARALRTGERVVVWPDSAHREPPVLFLPDGRAVGVASDSVPSDVGRQT